MSVKLCLGTAQFGLDYGLTNSSGQVQEKTVAHILESSSKMGIRWIDTAQVYGNAEAILGRQIPPESHYRIITKLAPQSHAGFSADDISVWNDSFSNSCQSLGVQNIDTLLLHSYTDLLKPGGQILESWLNTLREQGKVKRIGVSIYDAFDLHGLPTSFFDVIQLPLSLFDQRLLLDGTIHRLHEQGVAIHARSIYLQGLLLTPAEYWPNWIGSDVRKHQRNLEHLSRQKKCQLIDLALGFIRSLDKLELSVVGICNLQQLNQLQASWCSPSPWLNREWESWALTNPQILDPRLWPV